MAAFISELILENRGTFENKRSCDMNAYGVYGKTVQRALFESDEKKRYIHIYHSISKEADEREIFENALRERTALLMTAKEALHLYKSRDTSEKLFASDKSFLGNKSMRSYFYTTCIKNNKNFVGYLFMYKYRRMNYVKKY